MRMHWVNEGKTMQGELEYSSDSCTSSEGTPHVTNLTNESGQKLVSKTANGMPQKHRTKAKKEPKLCAVCHDIAAGTYFGASVCLPCKSFYIRCTKDDPNPKFTCAYGNKCEVNKQNRLRCQSCRFNKCLEAGMHRKEKLDHVEPSDGQELCLVCGDIANGCHFGIFTCEGCKKFYRRGMHEAETYECKADRNCPITPRTRNDCRYCRFQKCIAVGMSREAIKMGRPKKLCRKREDSHLSESPKRMISGCKPLVKTEARPTPSSTPLLTDGRQLPVTSGLQLHTTKDNSSSGSLVEVGQPVSQQPLMTISGAAGMTVGLSELAPSMGSQTELKRPMTIPVTTMNTFESSVVTNSGLAMVSSCQGVPKDKEVMGTDSDMMFSNPNVEVDLDNFIRTLDEQEVAILNSQVEPATSISTNQDYGEIIHWLKERETSTTSESYCQPTWEPVKASPTSSDMPMELTSTASVTLVTTNTDVTTISPSDVRLHDLKPMAASSIFNASYSDYLTLVSADSGSQSTDSALYAGSESSKPITVMASKAPEVPKLVTYDDSKSACSPTPDGVSSSTSTSDSSAPSSSTSLSSFDAWTRRRAAASEVCDVSPPDDSEMVTSTGQVKRRSFDSELSETAPKLFRMDYWISQMSVDIPQFTDEHLKLLTKLQNAYKQFVQQTDESNLPASKNTLDSAEETRHSLKTMKKRITRNLSSAMTFALSIPGFKSVEQSDQFHLVKYGGFHMMIILAGREQYIPEKHAFRYFWNAHIPNNHPAYLLRHDLLEAGNAVYSLKLDQIEAAALGALALTSTDLLQLNFPRRLETIKEPILHSLLAYIVDKHGQVIGRKRIEEMFHLMPVLRELTLRHAFFTQHLQLVIDASDLIKMCECIALEDCV